MPQQGYTYAPVVQAAAGRIGPQRHERDRQSRGRRPSVRAPTRPCSAAGSPGDRPAENRVRRAGSPPTRSRTGCAATRATSRARTWTSWRLCSRAISGRCRTRSKRRSAMSKDPHFGRAVAFATGTILTYIFDEEDLLPEASYGVVGLLDDAYLVHGFVDSLRRMYPSAAASSEYAAPDARTSEIVAAVLPEGVAESLRRTCESTIQVAQALFPSGQRVDGTDGPVRAAAQSGRGGGRHGALSLADPLPRGIMSGCGSFRAGRSRFSSPTSRGRRACSRRSVTATRTSSPSTAGCSATRSRGTTASRSTPRAMRSS